MTSSAGVRLDKLNILAKDHKRHHKSEDKQWTSTDSGPMIHEKKRNAAITEADIPYQDVPRKVLY